MKILFPYAIVFLFLLSSCNSQEPQKVQSEGNLVIDGLVTNKTDKNRLIAKVTNSSRIDKITKYVYMFNDQLNTLKTITKENSISLNQEEYAIITGSQKELNKIYNKLLEIKNSSSNNGVSEKNDSLRAVINQYNVFLNANYYSIISIVDKSAALLQDNDESVSKLNKIKTNINSIIKAMGNGTSV